MVRNLGYGSLSQKLPWKLVFNASIFGNAGHSPNNVYGYSRSWHSYTMSVQRSFLDDDRLTVRLWTRNPFKSHHITESVRNQGDYLENRIDRRAGRMFALSVSYRFGKLKASVKKTNSTIENDDIVGGITRGK